MPVFEKFKGRLLAVDEAPEVLEGTWNCTRTVLIEFPSREDALAWAGSAEYQEIARHRWAGSTANIAMIRSLRLDRSGAAGAVGVRQDQRPGGKECRPGVVSSPQRISSA